MSREVPDGWTPVKLGAAASNVAEKWEPGEHAEPYVGLEQLDQGTGRLLDIGVSDDLQSIKTRFRAGDVLFGKLRPNLRKTALVDFSGIASTDILVIRPSERMTPEFAFYRLSSDEAFDYAIKSAAGTKMPRTSWKDMADFEFPLPPLHEQRRIAEILSSADEAIAATRAVIEQTRKVKQGMLERLLTKGIGHTRFQQTEIGEIPEGWETGKIGDFFTLQRGFDITEKQSTAGEYPVVSSSGISYFHSEAMVHGPAVITGRKGKLGQVHFIDSSCWPHDTTLWVRDFKGNAPKFVYWFLRSLNLEKFDAATAVPTLNRNVVHALICAFPPVSEQLLISDHLDSIEATEDAQTRNLTAYGQMKSALVSDLLNGRKRVTTVLPVAAE